MFRFGIVRPPCTNFAQGLTTANLGPPDYERALGQHEQYCEALERCGLALTRLAADERYPDSTFVEDTAVLIERCAVLARPGATSRQGEVMSVERALASFYEVFHVIASPGTLDGGDVCEAGERFFIGISERTNEEGARQLASILAGEGYVPSLVDIRGVPGILHLKSGVAYLGDDRFVVIDALSDHCVFRGAEVVRVDPAESYAANCLRIGPHILLASGYPRLEERLCRLGCSVITLDVGEFRKMDGGLSCLSLRF
jgi:dimethylargininase